MVQHFFTDADDADGAEGSGEQNREDCNGQNALPGWYSGRQENGADGGLLRGLGNIVYETKQFFHDGYRWRRSVACDVSVRFECARPCFSFFGRRRLLLFCGAGNLEHVGKYVDRPQDFVDFKRIHQTDLLDEMIL